MDVFYEIMKHFLSLLICVLILKKKNENGPKTHRRQQPYACGNYIHCPPERESSDVYL